MSKTKLSGLFRLFRFELPFAAGVCVLLGQFLALGTFPSAQVMILGFLGVFFISASALILNDYFDLESDRINAPHRPLPSGLVTKSDVVLLSAIITALGLLASALISGWAFLAALFVWMVGFLYNWHFKKTGLWGNLMVSFSVGMTFVYGGITVGQPWEKSVWLFAMLAFFINLGEEITADAMDVEGDRRAGSRSLPILIGRENALKVSAAIFLWVVAISILPFLLGWIEWRFAIPIFVLDGVILYATTRLLNSQTPNRRRYIRWIYMSALAAILVFIVILFVA